MLNAINQQTRSTKITDYNRIIEDISVCGYKTATRNSSSPFTDTLAYIVNFTNNNGFAILGAQRSLEAVYAITDAGYLDPIKLNEAIARAQTYQETTENNLTPQTRLDSDRKIQEAGPTFIYRLVGEALINATPRIAADTLYKTYGKWQTQTGIGPLVEVKWDQDYPFNTYMPTTDVPRFSANSAYKGRFPVGCGVIAAAQIIATNRRPVYATNGTSDYNWTYLRSVSNYLNVPLFRHNNYPNSIDPTTQQYTAQLASVLYYLSVLFNAESDQYGTGTSERDIIDGLKTLDANYYAKAQIREDNMLMSGIFSCLANSKPVYLSGFYWDDGWHGHAWVVDGYFTRSREVTTVIRYGLSGPTQTLTGTEEIRYLHFNWGYGGDYDGYFSEGIYNMAQRYATDSTINVNTTKQGTSNYGMHHQAICY